MRNEPRVWPEVGDAGTSGAGALPLRSAQMMGQQQKKKRRGAARSGQDGNTLSTELGAQEAERGKAENWWCRVRTFAL